MYKYKTAIIYLTLLLLTNLGTFYWSLYQEYGWVDIAQHLAGGFFVAMFMVVYLRNNLANNFLKNVVVIVGATVLVGVLWEFAEYIANQALIEPSYKYFGIRAYFMGDLQDTIGDLLNDIIGSSVFSLLHFFRSRKRSNSFQSLNAE